MKRVRSWWNDRFLRNEFWAASLVALVLSLITLLWFPEWPGSLGGSTRGAIYGALTSIFGSLLGFVITGMSVLLALGNTPLITLLRKAKGVYQQVFDVFSSTFIWLAAGTGIALGGLLFDRPSSELPGYFLAVMWSVLVVGARMGRSLWILKRILAIVVADTADEQQPPEYLSKYANK